jgi:type II secretory pathway component PulF
VATPPAQTIRTKAASDKDRLFLFGQLGKQLNAGIGPAEALTDLKTRAPRHMSASLEDAAKTASHGKPISEALERYPDLYPEHVVGTIRSAEQGGFLPEACELISDQAMNAHTFKRWFWWVGPTIVNTIVSFPLVWLVLASLVKAWDVVEAQGEAASLGSTMAAMGQSALQKLLWPIGPLTLLLWGLSIWFWRALGSKKARRMRHELTFRWPVFGERAKHECLSVFAWIMSRVSKAGVSPNQAWQLAASSVPNLAVRERLERMGNGLSGSEKLSDALFKEKLFPAEYAPVIATAEHTGNIPEAFDQLSRVSQAEFDAAQGYARTRSGRWAFAVGCGVGGLLIIILIYVLYYVLAPAILRGLD